MKRLSLWIIGAACGSFAAGVNIGLVAPGWLEPEAASALDQDAMFIRQMEADYGLDAEQVRSLRLVMQNRREAELQVFTRAEFSMLPLPIQRELLRIREQEKQRILVILDEEQRERYERVTSVK